MSMKRTHMTVLSLFIASSVAFGQGQPGQRAYGQPELNEASSKLSNSSVPPVSLAFKGGSMAQLVEALAQASAGNDVNVVVSREAMGVEVPPMNLRNASVWAVLQAAARTSTDRNGAVLVADRVGADSGDQTGSDAGAIETYTVRLENRIFTGGIGAGPVGRAPEIVKVMSMADMLEANGPDAATKLLSALTAALELEAADEESVAQVKFHKETSLLIIRGTDGQQAVAKEVMEQLRADSLKRHIQAQTSEEAVKRVKLAASEVAEAQRGADMATRALNEFTEKFKDGVPPAESAEYTQLKLQQATWLKAANAAEKRLAEARGGEGAFSELETLRRRVQMLEQERDLLRGALKELGGRLEGK